MQNWREKINLENWKPINKGDKIENLMAEGTVIPNIFYDPNEQFPNLSIAERAKEVRKDKRAKKKAVLKLLENFPHEPLPDHSFAYQLNAPVKEFIKWAKCDEVGSVFLMIVENAIDLGQVNLDEWEKTNMIISLKVELVSNIKTRKFKNTTMEIWSVKAPNYIVAHQKIKDFFNSHYKKDFTGRIIGYSINDIDELDMVKSGHVQALWSDTNCQIDMIVKNNDYKQRIKENKYWGLPLTL